MRHALLFTVLLASLSLLSTSALAKTPTIKFESRNLYLGADIIQLATAPNLETEKTKVAQLKATVDATKFKTRAKAIVKEIKQNKPDVIGLQEVARYYLSTGYTPARTSYLDYMKVLQSELKKQKLSYTNVSEQTEMDITVPSSAGYNVRLKLGNAVLVRKGSAFKTKKAVSGNFNEATQLKITLADGQQVKLTRGYAGVDGVVGKKKVRFLDPHAEAYGAALAKGQFEELLAGAGKPSKKYTTVIAGDFNSDPADVEPNAYKAVIDAGYFDTGKRMPTCCQIETVNNPVSQLQTWIDHIVVSPKKNVRVISSKVIGNKTKDMVGGLWPSDHAGIIAALRFT